MRSCATCISSCIARHTSELSRSGSASPAAVHTPSRCTCGTHAGCQGRSCRRSPIRIRVRSSAPLGSFRALRRSTPPPISSNATTSTRSSWPRLPPPTPRSRCARSRRRSTCTSRSPWRSTATRQAVWRRRGSRRDSWSPLASTGGSIRSSSRQRASPGRCSAPSCGARSSFEEPLSGTALPGWKRRRATGGGAALDLASHHVDLVRHLLGTSLTPVAAELRSVESEHDDCTLRFDAGGCDVEIGCSFVRGRRDVLELVDNAGRTLELDRYASTLTVSGRRVRIGNLVATRAPAFLRPLSDPSYGPSLRAWADRVRGAEAGGSPASMGDGLASLEAILAVERLAVGMAT